MKNKRYKVGIIGLGARAETFARSLYKGTKRGELFAFCDIDEDRTRKFCEYCGFQNVRCFKDPSEFFSQKEMDAVVVTTPDFAHLDVVRLAFAAGKHAYIEKPLEVSSERCREIIRLHRASKVTAFVGFNLRASDLMMKAREIVQSGQMGRVFQIAAVEQLWFAHIAAFMRRFHRRSIRSGGLLNTKCCHDLDIIQWIIGHEHRVAKVASFGGSNILRPENAPPGHGETCHECPKPIADVCRYKDRAGFVFPIKGPEPLHKTQETDIYGGDLCAYTKDKDIVENQVVILEWDHGVRGTFSLAGFQAEGKRDLTVWGENGVLECDDFKRSLRLTPSPSGEVINFNPRKRLGGHGGVDPFMLGRFFDAIDAGGASDSGLAAGLAATLIAEKALESMRTGRVVSLSPEEYDQTT